MSTTRTVTPLPAEPAPGGDGHWPESGPADAAAPRRRSRAGVIVLVGLALVGGLAAGVVWHGPLGRAVGLGLDDRHDHAADAGGKKRLWHCSMHPQVIKEEPGQCPICQMELTPLDASPTGPAGGRKVKYWWDPMLNPPYISDKPGKSPMGMDLIPVYEDQVSSGTAVTIDPVVVQNMGVRVAEVRRGPVRQNVRAVGYLDEAQPNIHDVNSRVSGWVEKLYANTTGMHVKQGDPLFDLYSPEVQVAVEELIAARKAAESPGPRPDDPGRRGAEAMVDAGRRKLEQWGLGADEVDRLAKLDHAPRAVTFFSPATGHVVEKNVVAGSAVKAGDPVLRIVDHSLLWLDAQVYERDLPFIKLGQSVTATIEGEPGRTFDGKIVFVHPHLDPQTRTATVRMELPNPDVTLRPGMYATARIDALLAEDAVLVPREAVIDTGTREVAFVSAGGGRFEPRRVTTGPPTADGNVQVLAGLAPGETVVTSGQFLLDAESRMREAIQKHLDERLLTTRPAR